MVGVEYVMFTTNGAQRGTIWKEGKVLTTDYDLIFTGYFLFKK